MTDETRPDPRIAVALWFEPRPQTTRAVQVTEKNYEDVGRMLRADIITINRTPIHHTEGVFQVTYSGKLFTGLALNFDDWIIFDRTPDGPTYNTMTRELFYEQFQLYQEPEMRAEYR